MRRKTLKQHGELSGTDLHGEDGGSNHDGFRMKTSTVLIMGVAFTLGLMVGLLFELSSLSAPVHNHRHGGEYASSARAGRDLSSAGEDADVPTYVSAKDALGRHVGGETIHNQSQRTYNANSLRKHEGMKSKLDESDQNTRASDEQTLDQDQHSTLQTQVALRDISANRLAVPRADGIVPSSHVQVHLTGSRGPRPEATPAETDKISGDKSPITGLGDSVLSASDGGDHGRHGAVTRADIVTGIYWTPRVEAAIPPGFSDEDAEGWRKRVEQGRVVRMSEGCGRMQNRLVTLDDGSRACARYRLNTDLMQGEIYSYYLARLLGLRNLPPAVLVTADGRQPTWAAVNEDLSRAEWNPSKAVILSRWVDSLSPSFIPGEFRSDSPKLNPDSDSLLGKSLAELSELAQWSDLIVFDYITANLDRAVNNMFNKQWNHRAMDSPAHNLERSSKDHLLVYLDNESGLFHGYRLLDRYSSYHKHLLEALCVFRRGTAEVIARLHREQNTTDALMSLYRQHEPRHSVLPAIHTRTAKILQQRVADVYNQIQTCNRTYGL